MLNNLDRLNLELLRTFSVAARTSTFAEAAKLRGVTVSAISQQIRSLEVQLGLSLFERVGRRVRLTPSGHSLSAAVQATLAGLAEAVNRAVGAPTRMEGTVVLGGPRTFGLHFVAPRLVSLLRAHPGLRVDQQFDVPSILERRLLDGALDLAVLSRATEMTGLMVEPLGTETFVCVAAPALVRKHSAERTEAALQSWPWLIFDRDLPMHRVWWRSAFGRTVPPHRVAASVASLEQLEYFASAGVGAVVLPDYLVTQAVKAGRLVVVEPERRRTLRSARNTLFLAWRAGAPETVRFMAVREALLKEGMRPR